jgi:hypothetical protein
MEEHRWRVFENRVLRRIFGPKRDEVMGGWRNLHNEELHNKYSSRNINRMIKSRRMKRTGHVPCSTHGEECMYDFEEKVRRKRLQIRPRRRWKLNIKIDLGEIGWGGTNWINLAQNSDYWRVLAGKVINLRVHRILGNY